MGARQSKQKARAAELDITDIAANKQPSALTATAPSSTLAAQSSASTSPALSSLSSKQSKLTQQAWAPQHSRYVQQDKAEDAVTQWTPDEEEKENDDEGGEGKAANNGQAGDDLFGKYRSGKTAGSDGSGGVAGKRSGIVNNVTAASSVDRRQQPQPNSARLNTLMDDDDDGVDNSAVSAHNH